MDYLFYIFKLEKIQSTTKYSNGKLGCKEDLTYKQVENLIKEASRKLNKRNK